MNFDEFFVKVFMNFINFMIFVELALNIGESCELGSRIKRSESNFSSGRAEKDGASSILTNNTHVCHPYVQNSDDSKF